MASRRALAAALVLLLAACGGDSVNPFTAPSAVGHVRATAAVVFTSDAYAARAPAPRELFAVDEDGSGMTRLTNCNGDTTHCDNVEVAPASDGRRLAVRRALNDTNQDGHLGEGDTQSVVIIDLQRAVEGSLTLRVPSATGTTAVATDKLSGLDWSPQDDLLVYSAIGEGSAEDLFRTIPRPDTDLSQTRNLTFSPSLQERRPRIDPSGTVATYARADATNQSTIYIFVSSGSQTQVTTGGTAGEPLPGSPFVVGSDTDPDYSPDGQSLVFRRLTGLGVGGRGAWDVMTVRIDGTNLTTLVSGAAYRSAPDWGPKGIVFSEIDAAGLAQLVVVQPDGSGRRVLTTLSGKDIASPRWLPKP